MLHDRGIDLDLVHQAFVLALARRTFRADTDPLEPIRALRYFLPVIQEIVAAPPDPNYLQHPSRAGCTRPACTRSPDQPTGRAGADLQVGAPPLSFSLYPDRTPAPSQHRI